MDVGLGYPSSRVFPFMMIMEMQKRENALRCSNKKLNSLKKFNPTEAGGHFHTGSWISSHLFSSQPLFAAAQTVIQVFVKWKCLCHGHLS